MASLERRVAALEQRKAEATRPGRADTLRTVKRERAGLTPEALAQRSAEILRHGLQCDPDSIAGDLARRRAARTHSLPVFPTTTERHP